MNDAHGVDGVDCEYEVGDIGPGVLLLEVDLVLQKSSEITSHCEV